MELQKSRILFMVSRIIDVFYIIIGIVLFLQAMEPNADPAMMRLLKYISLAAILLIIRGLVILNKTSKHVPKTDKYKVDLVLNSIFLIVLLLFINLFSIVKFVEYVISN